MIDNQVTLGYIKAMDDVAIIANKARDYQFPDTSRKSADVYLGSHKSKNPDKRKAQKKARKISRR